MTHHKPLSIMNTFFCVLSFLLLPIHSYAFETVTQVDKLSFGSIAVLDNTTTSEITVDTQGRMTYSNDIRILDLGKPAYFVLFDYPIYTQLFTAASVLSAETVSSIYGSQQFTLINVTTASSVTTNGTGMAEVIIGGTLQTSGNGGGKYYDGNYTATLQLTISY